MTTSNHDKWLGWLIKPGSKPELPVTRCYEVIAPTPYAARKAVFLAFCKEKKYTPKKADVAKAIKAIRLRSPEDDDQ